MDFKWFQLQIIAITFYYPFFLWFILYYTMIDECCGTYMYLHHAYSSHSSHSSDSSDSPLHCFHMISTVCDFHTISICFYIFLYCFGTNLIQSVPVQRCYAVLRFRVGFQRDGALLKPCPRRSHGHEFQSYPVLVLSCPIFTRKKKGLRYVSYISLY